ncbi:MAG: hypothetical protein ACT4QF_16065 [Sporichthyaceae bacterium]
MQRWTTRRTGPSPTATRSPCCAPTTASRHRWTPSAWTYDQLAAGEISYEQAAVIASIVADLPKGASRAQTGKAERYLLDRTHLDPDRRPVRNTHRRNERGLQPQPSAA